MTLEDFERELAAKQTERTKRKRDRSQSPARSKGHRHHHNHHHRSRHERSSKQRDQNEREHRHRHSRRNTTNAITEEGRKSKRKKSGTPSSESSKKNSSEEDEWVEKETPVHGLPGEDLLENEIPHGTKQPPKRDAWMEAPSAVDVEYIQQRGPASPPSTFVRGSENDHVSRHRENELKHHLEDVETNPKQEDHTLDLDAQHNVDYEFGDAGSSWRMTKLKGVYDNATASGRLADDVAIERFGSLRDFDDAREEQIELDRRRTYGENYVGKTKPSGELYQERKLDAGVHRSPKLDDQSSEDEFEKAQGEAFPEKTAPAKTLPLNQTALNKLKAQMMKAKLSKSKDAATLEAEYNAALAAAGNRKEADIVVLNKMENRMLTGGRNGEVNPIDNKRGRERGQVEENEDMSIEDMVRQERRTRGQVGEGKAFAERIAKDAKFDNDLDYMDDNAAKLAKHVQKSEVNLRNTAISDYHKMKRILDTCPLCHHEDTNTPPQAPIISLGTRTFLTLPTAPEITPYGLCASVIPIQHRLNLLECDDDEWEEIRNFMKSLTRFYYSMKPSRGVIFYENAAHEGRKRHASMEAVPLPINLAEDAPQFFKEAILASDEEWTQHRKVIDTLAKATDGGMGKLAFRRSLVSELPYFHVWFRLDGGLGHVVEDTRRWPKGDLFAREILGGMLDVGPDVIKRQGRWRKGDPDMDRRAKDFQKRWDKWDWTKALLEAQ